MRNPHDIVPECRASHLEGKMGIAILDMPMEPAARSQMAREPEWPWQRGLPRARVRVLILWLPKLGTPQFPKIAIYDPE